MSEYSLTLDKQVCFALYSASNAVTRAYRPILQKLDLTYLQYMVMMVLWEHHSLNVKELGAKLHLDSGTLTPLLKRLDAKQLIIRTRGEQDERVRQISLTDAGAELKVDALGIPEQLACQIQLDADDALEIKRLCNKLLSATA